MGDHGRKAGTKKKGRKLKHRFFVHPSRFKHTPEGRVAEMDRYAVHHMKNVLRLSKGHAVTLFDDSGREYEGEIVDLRPSSARVRVISEKTPPVESPLKITLAQALIKGSGFERVITLCTELGMARLSPLFTRRTVARLGKKDAAERIKRWERIAEEAAAQSGRTRKPIVDMPADLETFLAGKREGAGIILWENAGGGQLKSILEKEGRIESMTLLVGPEGGFERAEVRKAMHAGYHAWGLGPRTMRAETAGPIAIGILQYLLGDIG